MSDCLIVGGGVIGMMNARALILAGAKVTLLEKNECGGESSWAGGGIISPLYPWQCDDSTNELSFASQAVYPDLCMQLFKDTGIDPEYQKIGLLMVDEFNTKPAKAWIERYQITYEPYGENALFTHVGCVRTPKLLQALKADIISKGVQVIEHTQVNSIISQSQQCQGVKTSGGVFLSKNVVICAGAWSGQLLNLEERVFPIKGQMIVIQASIDELEHIILNQGRYLIPRSDGKILVGSSMEDVGFDHTIDEDTKASLYEFAGQHVPALKRAKIIYHWSGLRPATDSGKALIARHQGYDNLFINTGHFRNGLNMAPESANKIKALIYD